MSISNGEAANDLLDTLEEQEQQEQQEFADLQEVRDDLETPPEPAPDGGQAATANEDADADDPGMPMDPGRRVGTITLTVDGEDVEFGKPSGRASMQMLQPINEMEQGGGELQELGDYVWGTLAYWSLDDDRDLDHWADEHGLWDAVQACRSLALGGNAPAT